MARVTKADIRTIIASGRPRDGGVTVNGWSLVFADDTKVVVADPNGDRYIAARAAVLGGGQTDVVRAVKRAGLGWQPV